MRAASVLACASLCGVAAISPQVAVYVQDIGATGAWKVTNENGSISVNATVPGQVHLDLLAAGIIAEPYLGESDGPTGTLGWVAYDNWTYTCTFLAPTNVTTFAMQEIAFEGLDTIASVTLNGKLILSSTNMFRRFNVPVRGVVRPGANSLTVAFTSAPLWATAQMNAYPNISNHSFPHVNFEQGFSDVNFIRKEPSGFAWDWGPGYATQGIWKNVTLLCYNLASIRSTTTTTTPVDMAAGVWTLTANVTIAAVVAQTGTLFIQVGGASGSASFSVSLVAGQTQTVSVALNVSGVTPWWPNGFTGVAGAPVLYTTTFQYIGLKSESSVIVQRVGFRTVNIVQDPLPGGSTFKFNVNGLDIFAKGANWVPSDAFDSRTTTPMLGDLFDSYQEANFNMLRVWGGGVYQRDEFYDLADERGFLIWQEFMFACALYPVAPAFLNDIAAEVQYQVARLQHHPSIAVWGGNNENGISIADNWYGIGAADMPQYIAEYVQLYFNTVLANYTDDYRMTVSTSPSDGDQSAANPIPSTNPGAVSGDTHFYTNADVWNPMVFPRPRFVSEFGFNSYASWITMQPYVLAQQAIFSDPIWAWRDHSGGANAIQLIRNNVALHYPSPASDDYIRDWLWMSQVVHGMYLKLEVEHYRRIRNECSATLEGCTMGTLYWQANDIWPASSWSSIEYGGRWKVAHYYVKKAYNPTAVSMWDYGGTGGLYFVNDDPVNPASGQVAITAYSYASGQLGTWTVPFTMTPASAGNIANFTHAQLVANTNCPSSPQCVWVLQAATPAYVPLADNFFIADNITASTPLKDPKWVIKSVTNGPSQGVFTVAYTGYAVALFTWLETPVPGHFDDNGFVFTAINGYSTVNFATKNLTITAAELLPTIQMWSLYDIQAGRALPPIPPLP